MVFSFKNCTRMVFVCIWFLQIRRPHQYYALTIPVWGQIFTDTGMVSKKITIPVWGPIPAWWCLDAYGDITRMGTNIYIYTIGPTLTASRGSIRGHSQKVYKRGGSILHPSRNSWESQWQASCSDKTKPHHYLASCFGQRNIRCDIKGSTSQVVRTKAIYVIWFDSSTQLYSLSEDGRSIIFYRLLFRKDIRRQQRTPIDGTTSHSKTRARGSFETP